MRAVVIDPEAQSATVETVPDPLPEPDQILVKVHASGLNRADLAAKGGGYRTGRAPGPFIAGSELAGFALLQAVKPEASELVLVLQRPGRARVTRYTADCAVT